MAQNKHRNDENTIFNGNPPEIEKLYNGRYRFTFRCTRDDNNTGWYYENRENLFAEFGDLSQTPYAKQGKGVTPPTGQTWPDLRLIQHGWVFIPQIDVPLLQFVYETLTDTYVEDRKETVDYELNGLRRVTRTLIAKEGTTYGKTVGTDTISHTAIGYGTETLYLASVEDIDLDDDEGGFTRIRETWLQAGQVFRRESNPSDGLKQITTGWWKVIGATVGPIIEKSTENFEGFEIFSVTTMNAPDGSDITDGENDKLVDSFQTLSNWTRPGIVGLEEAYRFPSTSIEATRVQVLQKAPCQMRIRANVEIYFSKNNNIADTDFDTITGGTGVKYWNPDEWVTLEGAGANDIDSLISSVNRTYRGFRAIDSTDADYSATYPKNTTSASARAGVGSGVLPVDISPEWFGSYITAFIYGGAGSPDPNGLSLADANLVGGPEKPEGKIWMIDVQNPKAFTDIDGVDYYKKTYVWSYIPDFDAGEDIWDDAP